MAIKRIVDRHNRLRPDAKPRMMPSKLCRRWSHIGGESVTRRLRRAGREVEEERRMTPAQCRAARALIGWSQEELFCGIEGREATIANFELGKRPYDRTLDELRAALEAAGVEFTNGAQPGVRLKKATP
jgi:ribosome-binding protein aMBF1 (putative translation factor)